MKTTITMKEVYPLYRIMAASAVGAAIKMGLVRTLSGKPMDEKQAAQAMTLSGKREHYWQQITMSSSRL